MAQVNDKDTTGSNPFFTAFFLGILAHIKSLGLEHRCGLELPLIQRFDRKWT